MKLKILAHLWNLLCVDKPALNFAVEEFNNVRTKHFAYMPVIAAKSLVKNKTLSLQQKHPEVPRRNPALSLPIQPLECGIGFHLFLPGQLLADLFYLNF